LKQVWAGVDIGKGQHHAVVIDTQGTRLLSRRITNAEPALLELLADVLALAEEITWALDLTSSEAALLLALLADHGQRVIYRPGMAVNRASGSYRDEGKTHARDAYVTADQARIRRDLQPMRSDDELVVELRMLTTRRGDLAADRTRAVNRLRVQLLAIFPALERALDLTSPGPPVLLTGYQSPAVIRRTGKSRLQTWLRNRKVRGAAELASRVIEAANTQHISLPGQKLAAPW
jgi:transposase